MNQRIVWLSFILIALVGAIATKIFLGPTEFAPSLNLAIRPGPEPAIDPPIEVEVKPPRIAAGQVQVKFSEAEAVTLREELANPAAQAPTIAANTVALAPVAEKVISIEPVINETSDDTDLDQWFTVSISEPEEVQAVDVISTDTLEPVVSEETPEVLTKTKEVIEEISETETPVEPVQYAFLAQAPNDTYVGSESTWNQNYPDLWGFHNTNADSAWNVSQGSNVVIAVVDTGVDINHPDIASNIWQNPGEIPNNNIDDDGNGFIDDVNGWNFNTNSNDIIDNYVPNSTIPGHGTHVAGTIAAVANNGQGIAGVAPQAKIMVLKAFDPSCNCGAANVLTNSIYYAARNGAHITNNSWTMYGGQNNPVLRSAFAYAHSRGVLNIAAAGNNNTLVEAYSPANYNESTIAVAAIAPNDSRANFSNFGSSIDIAAPGVDILSLHAEGTNPSLCPACFGCNSICVPVNQGPRAGYIRFNGTSMASPHVAGVAALVKSQNPSFSPDQIYETMLTSARSLPNVDPQKPIGAGAANAAFALGVDPNATPIPPTPTPAVPTPTPTPTPTPPPSPSPLPTPTPGPILVDLKVNGTDSPAPVQIGSNILMAWTFSNASNCTASDDWSGIKTDPTGHELVQAQSTGTKTFTLTCNNPVNSAAVSDTVTVNVVPIPPTPTPTPAPTPIPGTPVPTPTPSFSVDLKANNADGPFHVSAGETLNFTYTTSEPPTRCVGLNDMPSEVILPPYQLTLDSLGTKSFTVRCYFPPFSTSSSDLAGSIAPPFTHDTVTVHVSNSSTPSPTPVPTPTPTPIPTQAPTPTATPTPAPTAAPTPATSYQEIYNHLSPHASQNNPFDINKDGRVSFIDAWIVYQNSR